MKGKKLRRSKNDRILAGVVGGIAEFIGIDPTILRVLFLIVTWSGFPVVLYILLAIVIPVESSSNTRSYYSTRHDYSSYRPRKEARKVEEDEEDWSDF